MLSMRKCLHLPFNINWAADFLFTPLYQYQFFHTPRLYKK